MLCCFLIEFGFFFRANLVEAFAFLSFVLFCFGIFCCCFYLMGFSGFFSGLCKKVQQDIKVKKINVLDLR